MPFTLGVVLFMLASGLSIVLHKGLPVWLGWLAFLIGILGVTPVGFFAHPATALWILVVSILLTVRAAKAKNAPTNVGPS